MVLSRDHTNTSHPIWGIRELKVFVCDNSMTCEECPMQNKECVVHDTRWVHYICNGVRANSLVLTQSPHAYVIACEVKAFGYLELHRPRMFHTYLIF